MPYTGRLGNQDSQPGNIKLAFGEQAAPPPPPLILPFIDPPTAVLVAPYGTSLTAFRRASSVTAFPRRTRIVID